MGTYIYPISKNFLNLSGGTVTGNTYFQASLSADTIFSGSTELSLIFGDKHWKPGSSGNYSIRANNNSVTDATGNYAVAEGYDTSAFGDNSHAEGLGSITYGSGAHAEGAYTTASDYAHSEGIGSTASGIGSHAEGLGGTASGNYSHAQGSYNNSTGENSFVGGKNSFVYADNSFVFGVSHVLSGQRSAIFGGINMTGSSDDTVYVPYLNIQSANTASSSDYFLARSSTGEIKLSTLNSLSAGTLSLSAITSGVLGDTIRHNGTNWIANNLLYNNGTSIGINNISPVAPLDVSGKTRTTNFQMLSGASTGYVLTAANSSGDAYWAPSSGGGGSGATTFISNGLNTYTGGTATNPTVNISGGTFDNLTVTGATSLSSVFATDFTLVNGSPSAGYKLTALNSLGNSYWAPDISIYGSGTTGYLVKTLYVNSGNTILTVENSKLFEDTSNLKADVINDDYSIKLKTNNISSEYSSELEIKTDVGNPSLNLFVSAFEGNVGLLLKEGKINLKSISISANTEGNIKIDSLGNLYSNGTIETHVQPGTNIYTGGTATNPTVNISGGTFDNINASGNSYFNSFSATTIFSGSTDISSLFATPAQLTSVQNGLNTYTGGTATNPTVNISGGTFANINASGSSVFSAITASTITVPVIVGGSELTSGIIYSASSSTAITSTAIAHSFQGGPSGGTVFASINHTGKTVFNASGVAIPANITKNFAILDINSSFVQFGEAGGTPGYTNIWFGTATPTPSNYVFQANGTSQTTINAPTNIIFRINGFTVQQHSAAGVTFTPIATSGGLTQFTMTAAAHTALTAGVDTPTVNFNLSANRQFASGAKILQRDFVIQAPTYSAVGATTTTDAATLAITGAPVKSTNMTITNTHAVLIQKGQVSTATNSYGLTVNAQSGATNNYAAQFSGGSVGIGTSTPSSTIDTVGSQGWNTTSVSANTTLDSTHCIVYVDATSGNITITLPAVSGIARRTYFIIKTDVSANTVTIDGNGSETINGALTKVLSAQYSGCGINTQGTSWFIISTI